MIGRGRDAGAVWGLLTELASLPIGRHSLLFMVAGLGNMAADPRQAHDSAMKDFVYPYQEACASLVMVVTEALLHPRTAGARRSIRQASTLPTSNSNPAEAGGPDCSV